jgi:hypothetical protein
MACPELIVPVPNVAVPSLKVTVPVGVPLPAVGLTVAVKVTETPEVEGLSDETIAVVVEIGVEEDWFTV